MARPARSVPSTDLKKPGADLFQGHMTTYMSQNTCQPAEIPRVDKVRRSNEGSWGSKGRVEPWM